MSNKITCLTGALLLFGAATLCAPRVSAQNAQSSPYSRFAFGTLNKPASAAYKGMGGAGIAVGMDKAINLSNPASYAAGDSLSFLFDAGVSLNWSHYWDAASKKNTILGNLEYLALQFPVYSNKVSVSMGLVPFSNAGYGLRSNIEIVGDESYNRLSQSFTGKGATQSVYLGVGGRLLPNLYVGANARYLFGAIEHTTLVEPNSSLLAKTITINTLRLSGFSFDVGAQYHFKLNKEDQMSVGATFTPSLPIKPELTFFENKNYGASNKPEVVNDKLTAETKLPMAIGLGLSWTRSNKLLVAGDVIMTKWGSVPNIFVKDGVVLKDTYEAKMGMQYQPDLYARAYHKRMIYRAGLGFESSYTDIAPVGMMHRATASLGLSLPVNTTYERLSYLTLALEYAKAFPTNSSILNEDMLRVTLGVNFNETWFRKLKIW